jgi:AraC-like DNA-binding protein
MQASPETFVPDEWVNYKHLLVCDHLLLTHAQFTQHTFPVHYHDEFMIELVETGIEKFKYKGVTQYASRGQFILINPGEVHNATSGSDKAWRYRAFYPSLKLLQDVAYKAELNVLEFGFRSSLLNNTPWVETFKQAHRNLEHSINGLEQESIVLELFADLLGKLTHKPIRSYKKEHRAIQQIKEYLVGHVSQAVSLQKLSKVTELSSYHLLKVFKHHTGLSPHQYQTQLRIRLAYKKILAGQEAKYVATELGFFDQSHFIKVFRQYYGATPKQIQDVGKNIVIS